MAELQGEGFFRNGLAALCVRIFAISVAFCGEIWHHYSKSAELFHRFDGNSEGKGGCVILSAPFLPVICQNNAKNA